MTYPRSVIGHLFLSCLCVVVFLCFGCSDIERIEATESTKISKKDRIDLAIAQEVEMTKDPKSGEVPREKLFKAYKALKVKADQSKENYSINWTERGPDNVGGRTRALLIDANDASHETVWAGSVGGGLWQCTNISSSTPNWTPVNDFFNNMAITCIAQDPVNPDIMYFGTGEGFFNADAIRGMGIWKSTNGGSSWFQLGSTANSIFYYNQKLIVDSSGNVFAATRNGGIQRSQDGGNTWSKILGINQGAVTNRAADIEIAANGDLFAGMGIFSEDGVYKSTDGGTNWNKLTNGLPSGGYRRVEIACAPSDPDRLYVLFHEASSNDCEGIYRSSDGGSTFTAVSNPGTCTDPNFCRGQAWYDLTAAVDPNDKDRLFIGGVDLLVSSNGGNNFSQISQWYGGCEPFVHADHHIILFAPGNSDVILFGNDGGVFRTTNGSSSSITFESKNDGYNVTQFYGTAIHPDLGVDHFLAGAQDNGSHRFDNPGMNSTTEVTGGDGAFCHIDQDEPNYQFTAYVYNNYRRSINGGSSFTYHNFANVGRFINPTDYDNTEDIFYGAYSSGNYFRWDNPQSGSTASIVGVSDFNGSMVSAVTCSPNTSNRVFFGMGDGNVVKVDDAHSSSQTTSIIRSGSGYVSCIEVETGNDDHILVTYSNYGVNSVWETTNGGTSWTSVEGDLPDMPVRWALFNPHDANEALLATELGVWYTDDLNGGSTNWVPAVNGMANVRTDMLQWRASDNEIIASTHGRGLYSTSSFEIALPVEWLSFSAEKEGKNVVLDWSTATEENNDGFEIQRSSTTEDYKPIGWVDAKGQSVQSNHYSFVDDDIPASHQTWYYRLRQVDRDGGEDYSETRYVRLNTFPADLTIWPNPVADYLNLSVKTDVNYEIITANGVVKRSGELQSNSPVQIAVSNWEAGIYWIVYRNGNSRDVKKFMISRNQ